MLSSIPVVESTQTCRERSVTGQLDGKGILVCAGDPVGRKIQVGGPNSRGTSVT